LIDTNADGSLKDETVTTTSASGLLKTTQQDTTGAVDASGNPIFDQSETDGTVVNADGSRICTVTDTSANGTLLDQTVTTTNANGLSVTTQGDRPRRAAGTRLSLFGRILRARTKRTKRALPQQVCAGRLMSGVASGRLI